MLSWDNVVLILAFCSGPTVRNNSLLLCQVIPILPAQPDAEYLEHQSFIIWIKALNVTVNSTFVAIYEVRVWRDESSDWHYVENEAWLHLNSLKRKQKMTDRTQWCSLNQEMCFQRGVCVCVQYFKRNCLMWLIRDVWQLLTSPLHCIELICIAITRAAIEMQIKANMED